MICEEKRIPKYEFTRKTKYINNYFHSDIFFCSTLS